MPEKTAKKEVHAEVIEIGKSDGLELSVQINKESQQVTSKKAGGPYVDPRIRFSDLVQFVDLNTWHKRCIMLKARLVAGLGWQLVTDHDDKKPDEFYNKISAFLNRPNEHYHDSFTSIATRFMVDYYAIGNGFLECSRNLKNEVAAIYHIRGRNMRRKPVKITGTGAQAREVMKGYIQLVDAMQREFASFGDEERGEKNEIIHMLDYDVSDDYYGAPGWLPALGAMILDRSAVEFNTYMFENEMTAKFLLIIEGGNLSPEARLALKNFLAKKAMGIKNAGRALEVSIDDPNAKIRIEKLTVENKEKDLSFSVGRSQNRDEIIAAHGVPPRMLGIMSAGQLGGTGEIEGQLTTFKQITIDPDQAELEKLLNKTIIASFGEHKWQLKFDEMDITDALTDAEYYLKLTGQQALLTVDEAREEMGRGPHPDGEVQVTQDGLAKHITGTLDAIQKFVDQADEL